MDREPGSQRGLALFDFDGTLTRGDTFAPFVRFAVGPWRFKGGSLLLAPWIAAYRLGWLSAKSIRTKIVRWGFVGWRESDVREAGQRYAREHLQSGLRDRALERIAYHRSEGHTIAVVSASLDVYLQAFCAEHGLDLISNRLEVLAGTLTGRYEGGDCSGPAKAERIRQRYDLSQFAQIYAYGDTADDHAMLALASHRFYRWPGLGD
jgi:HAD superfamily hydrolase (TIGR01490 family)